ncbi:trypsin-1-like isoform X1 [Hermetia illucens]|uniref:trypsin-1-like isoform X1 n=1 Tax=Hermetia illucens TaxID=343691 RepID=UPI0018CC1281|nr:trypsin-1-like isoform X1 [Hermetia illucens]
MLTVIQVAVMLLSIVSAESTSSPSQLIRPSLLNKNGLRLQLPSKPNKNNLTPKIIGGTNAHNDDTKYQVSIRLRAAERIFGSGHICGGSLISYTTVLTAAHCLFYFNDDNKEGVLRSSSEFSVVMGTMDRFIRTATTLSYTITSFKYHEQFNTEDMRNDIALMFLNGQVPPNFPTVQPISPATYAVQPGSICQINGWGTDAFQGAASNILLTANVTLFSPKDCRRRYGDMLLSGMMCAGDWSGSHDACQGDSGGPLVYQRTLIGIVSWGNKCGSPDWPGIYTNVTYYQNWIRTNRGSHQESIHSIIMLCLLSSIFIKLV